MKAFLNFCSQYGFIAKIVVMLKSKGQESSENYLAKLSVNDIPSSKHLKFIKIQDIL